MKAKLIAINWVLSLTGLSIDTETAPLCLVILLVAWFFGSCLLLKYADRRGWMDKIFKRYKLDDL
jgi:hypothetical protein